MPELSIGDLVWAKMKGYPAWPGKVVYPPTSLKPKKSHSYVFFFGTDNYAWVPDKNIFPYAENFEKLAHKYKTASFKKAVEAIVKYADEGTCSDSSSDLDGYGEEDDGASDSEKSKKPLIVCIPMKNGKNKAKSKKKANQASTSANNAAPSVQPKPTSANNAAPSVQPKRIVSSKKGKRTKKKTVKIVDISTDSDEAARKRARLSSENPDETLEGEDGDLPEIIEIGRFSPTEDLSNEPLTHIKIESDYSDCSISGDEEELPRRPLVLAEKPKRLGYLPENVIFRPTVVAERKAARLKNLSTIQSNASQQSSTPEPSGVGSEVPQTSHEVEELSSTLPANISESHVKVVSQKKQQELSSKVSVSVSESRKKKVSFKSLPGSSGLIYSKKIRKLSIAISKKDRDICEEKLAELAGKVKTTEKTIGIIGLGKIGKVIVKNLLHTGHKLNIWDSEDEKLIEFRETGATSFPTPADIGRSSDIIILCLESLNVFTMVTDSEDNIFLGFEENAHQNKGLVNMTFVGPQKSTELHEKMAKKGLTYLEVLVAEHMESVAGNGKLVLMCAGDLSLYKECASCFSAISGSKVPVYMSNSAKDASAMKLVYISFTETVYSGFQEALATAAEIKVFKHSFVEFFKHTSLNSSGSVKKATDLLKVNAKLESPLTYVLHGMGMAILLANKVRQPMRALSVAHETGKMRKYFCDLLAAASKRP